MKTNGSTVGSFSAIWAGISREDMLIDERRSPADAVRKLRGAVPTARATVVGLRGELPLRHKAQLMGDGMLSGRMSLEPESHTWTAREERSGVHVDPGDSGPHPLTGAFRGWMEFMGRQRSFSPPSR
jgi:hypothetical protein